MSYQLDSVYIEGIKSDISLLINELNNKIDTLQVLMSSLPNENNDALVKEIQNLRIQIRDKFRELVKYLLDAVGVKNWMLYYSLP